MFFRNAERKSRIRNPSLGKRMMLKQALLIFIIILSGLRPSPPGTAATTGLLHQPQMIIWYGAICGLKIGRGNRSTRRKPAPAPFCLP
jgi:hypothetical protein